MVAIDRHLLEDAEGDNIDSFFLTQEDMETALYMLLGQNPERLVDDHNGLLNI